MKKKAAKTKSKKICDVDAYAFIAKESAGNLMNALLAKAPNNLAFYAALCSAGLSFIEVAFKTVLVCSLDKNAVQQTKTFCLDRINEMAEECEELKAKEEKK